MNDINNLNTQLTKGLSRRQLQLLTGLTIGIVLATLVLAIVVHWSFVCVGALIYVGVVYFFVRGMIPALMAGGRPAGGAPVAPTAPKRDLSLLEGNYRASMERALQTRGSIERTIAQTADPGLRRALTDAIRDLEELTQTIYDLALKGQSVVSGLSQSNSMARLSEEIEKLNNAIKSATDEFQKSQYYATLDGKLQQMQNLTDTSVAVKRWDAQLDNALSTLDTIQSQVLRIRSSDILGQTGETDDLSRRLREQVSSLKAASDAFDSVYGSQSSF